MQRDIRKTASGFYLLVSIVTAVIIIFAAHENNTRAVAGASAAQAETTPTE